MLGGGKYDALCTYVRESMKAEGAILIVLDGARGSGAAAQLPPEKMLPMADTLERMAQQMREDVRRVQT